MAKLKILFVADPLQKLKLESDTSLMMAHRYLREGFDVFWTSPEHLLWTGWELFVRAHWLAEFELKTVPSSHQEVLLPLTDFAGIVIRKDPPFNESYQRMCWMLAPYEGKLRMINRPSQLIRFHEKMLPYEARIQGYLSDDEVIPMSLVTRPEDLRSFVEKFPAKTYVIKPWLGFAGHEIIRESRDKLLRGTLPTQFRISNYFIVQPFLDAISLLGDRRVLFIQGHYVGSFVRLPKPGDFIANLARGGHAEVRELGRDQRKVILKLEKFIHSLGIEFAGADLIGHQVSEINITSPTGLMTLRDLTGEDKTSEFLKGF